MMSAPARPFRAVCLLLLVAALTGCGNGGGDLRAWIQEVKSKPTKEPDMVPAAPEYDKFTYQAHALRDPFLPFRRPQVEGASGPRPDQNRPKEPLEEFPIDALRMAGSIGAGVRREGLVVDPNNVTHRIGVGRYLGKNEGRVVGVSEDRIDIVELVSVGGGWEEKPAALLLEEP